MSLWMSGSSATRRRPFSMLDLRARSSVSSPLGRPFGGRVVAFGWCFRDGCWVIHGFFSPSFVYAVSVASFLPLVDVPVQPSHDGCQTMEIVVEVVQGVVVVPANTEDGTSQSLNYGLVVVGDSAEVKEVVKVAVEVVQDIMVVPADTEDGASQCPDSGLVVVGDSAEDGACAIVNPTDAWFAEVLTSSDGGTLDVQLLPLLSTGQDFTILSYQPRLG